jgi:hypothetical protein
VSDERAHLVDAPAAEGMSRRSFVQQVVAASAVTSLTTVSLEALSMPPGAAAGVLTNDQRRVLVRVLDRLIPREGAMPGAGEIGTAAFVEEELRGAPHLRTSVVAVIDALPDAAGLQGLSEADLHARLAAIEQQQPEAFGALLQTTYRGYYGHPAVVAALG